MKLRRELGLIGCAALLAGCMRSSPGRLAPPGVNSKAGEDAVGQYDADRDGVLGGPELDKAPGLKAALARIDRNGDKRLSCPRD